MAGASMDRVEIRLIRMILRAFYETRHVVAVDAVLKHRTVRDDELAMMMGMSVKDLQKLAGKLREDRILTIHTRNETKPGQQRPVLRTYYYIDYRTAVDAIKWKIHRLGKLTEEGLRNDFDQQGYLCPNCGRRYSTLEVLPLMTATGFSCADCGHELQDDTKNMEASASRDKLSRLMHQIERIINMLKEIDSAFVPETTSEVVFNEMVPVHVDSSQASQAAQAPQKPKPVIPLSNGPSVEISFDDDEKAEQESKEKTGNAVDISNELPVWHTMSTVSGELTQAGSRRDVLESSPSKLVQSTGESEDKKILSSSHDEEIASYYAALRAKQEKENDEEGGGWDDGDDFVANDNSNDNHMSVDEIRGKRSAESDIDVSEKRVKFEDGKKGSQKNGGDQDGDDDEDDDDEDEDDDDDDDEQFEDI